MHGELLGIAAGDQAAHPLRHIWWCNCHRCRCDPAVIRETMLADGISADCLGSYEGAQWPVEVAAR